MSEDRQVDQEARKSGRSRTTINYSVLNSRGRSVSSDHGEKQNKDSSQESPVAGLLSEQASRREEVAEVRFGDLEKMADEGEQNVPKQSLMDERESLEKTLRDLQSREEELEERSRMETLRERVEKSQRNVSGLEAGLRKREEARRIRDEKQSKTKGPLPSNGAGEDVAGMLLNLNSLRGMGKLKGKVGKELKKLGLTGTFHSESESDDSSSSESSLDDNDSSSDSDDDDDDDDDDDFLVRGSKKVEGSKKKHKKDKKKKKKKKSKSGIEAKISDKVVNRQDYPQAHLRYDFVSKKIEFQKLDWNLFVAGELEIISSCKSSKERKGRLELLKKIMYLVSSYEFAVVRALYAAVLREIELGHKKWGDDFQYVESAVLARHKQKVKTSFGASSEPKAKFSQYSLPEDGVERIWFCAQFQRNKCPHKSAHTLQVKGSMRYAKHVCATCWQKDRKQLNHPECSSACPHAAA